MYVFLSLLLHYLVQTHFLKRRNNSITDSTIETLAAQVWLDYLRLIRVLADVGQSVGLTLSIHIRSIPQIEDTVARTNHVFGLVLHTIPNIL